MDTESLAEVDAIIGMMSKLDVAKIPISFINFIKSKKSQTYTPDIKSDVPISEQPLKPYTKMLCSLIYRTYLCSKEERAKLEQEDKELIAKHEQELREKYNPDNIFNKQSVENINQIDASNQAEAINTIQTEDENNQVNVVNNSQKETIKMNLPQDVAQNFIIQEMMRNANGDNSESESNQNTQMIEVKKESFITSIISKIKNIFSKKQ